MPDERVMYGRRALGRLNRRQPSGLTRAAADSLVRSPFSLPSLAAFWNAGVNVTLTSGAVSSWVDQTSNAFSLAQATAGNRPTQSLTGGPNGVAAINFASASSHFLSIASACGMSTTNFTIFIAGKSLSTAAGMMWLDLGDANGAEGLGICTDFFGANNRDVVVWGGGGVQVSLGAATTNAEVWTVFRNTTTFQAHVNAAAVSPTNPGTAPTAYQATSTVGSATGGGDFLNGSIYEIILCNALLPAATIAAFEAGYLRSRYALW